MANYPNDPNQLGNWPENHMPPSSAATPFIFSTLPQIANLRIGVTAYTSDQGLVIWNGTSWTRAFASILADQSAVPVTLPPSGFFANNGVLVIGQAPNASATASFSATSGAGVTMTMSGATLLGTAADVGRVLTILDTTYKFATITTQSSTTVATVTLTGTLSGTGPFANNSIWLSGSLPATANTSGFSVPLQSAYPNLYLYLPANSISSSNAAGIYFAQATATTLLTVYNNPLTTGAPTVPTTLVPFATTGNGAYTQTTGSNLTVVSVPIPANIGARGRIGVYTEALNNLSAGIKSGATNFGGGLSTATFSQTSTNQATPSLRYIQNRGVTNAQAAMSGTGLAAAAGITATGALDTTVSQNLLFQLQLATATDWCQYDMLWAEITPLT